MTDELLNHPGAFPGDVRPTASYTLRVNGVERPVSDAWIGESLLYVLRERLGLAGAKDGCEQGECGACSVQVDGQLVNGCLVPAALAADSEINTVEGLSGSGGASDVQQALADSGAVQCGYCTPGMAMAVHDLLQRNHRPSDIEARQALCGNLCRCTGYRGALAAVQAVADAREAALEAELDAAEQAAAAAPATGAPAAASPAAEPAAAPQATEQSFADLVLAGELPLYADSELWHEADQLIPPQAQPEPAAGYAHPAAPAPAPAGWEPTPAHGTAADAAGYGTPAHGTPYLPTPPHGTQHQDPGGYAGTPAHGVPAHGAPPHGTPAHGTPAYGTPAYGVPVYGVPHQDPQEQGVYDGAPPHDTPPHGIPHQDAGAYDGTVYATDGHGHQYTGYDATPAHGIRLPEDENA
ncbi:2Fe-2S iron-sulfur cluster-binding protein [Kitasatospora sp. NPDC059646]|uniref:(2Fe-2S)-binding protein n=1 Tax=Kitasatospora sp. NPDC059646 TaxID=3346893 RepID=UPI0036757D1F